MSIGHEVGVIKLPGMAAGHGNPSVLTNQIQRYITELSSAANMYDQFSSPVLLDGDFEWEIEYFGTTVPYSELIGSISGGKLCRVHAGGKLRGYFGSSYLTGNSFVVNDGKLHRLSGKRLGNTVAIYVDGVEDNVSSGSSFLGSMSIDTLMRYGGVYADGSWLNLKIWTGGDRDTGTLVVDAKKDEDGSSNVIGNSAATIGDNISDINEQNSVPIGGPSVSSYPVCTTVAGTVYKVSATVTDFQGGSRVGFINGGGVVWGQAGSLIGENGILDFVYTATSSGVLQLYSKDVNECVFSDISIKEIPASTPLLIRVNQTTDEVTRYTDTDDAYIGPNVWTLSSYAFTGLEDSGDIPQTANILVEGNTYISSFSGGGGNVGLTTGGGGATRALLGNVSLFADDNPFSVTDTITAQTVTARWQVLGTPPFEGQVSIDSINRYVEKA